MIPFLAGPDPSVLPPVNATLNGISAILLIVGYLFIRSGRIRAHRRAMIGALVSSTAFLACYLTYHYGAGHTEFPKAYPLARKIYLAILLPHVVLAVVNLPFIFYIVVQAARGRFEKHRRVARFVFPSWLFVSITGVVIYFMIYHWFPAPAPAPAQASSAAAGSSGAAAPRRIPGPVEVPAASSAEVSPTEDPPVAETAVRRDGDLVFSPAAQTLRVDPGKESLEVFFKVENSGQRPVRIARLESSCECLSVTIDRNPIPAKGLATIQGLFDVTKLRGSTERQIVVTPEGRDRPVFLNTRIEIEPVYEIVEAMTTWARGSEPITKTVEFRVAREAPVHVLSAESKRPEVTCELVEVEKGRLYHLKLTPVSTEKTLLGIVRLETDCELETYARPLAYYSIQ